MHTELCVFSDSSTKAIGVAYLKAVQEDRQVEVGFFMAKAKLAPQSIQDELDLQLNATTFFTDNKVVLGYIWN